MEYTQLIIDDILGEIDAIDQYSYHIEMITDTTIKSVLSSILNEEKIHLGELCTLLSIVPEYVDEYMEGNDEVIELLSECIELYENSNRLLEVKDKEYPGLEFTGESVNISDDNYKEKIEQMKNKAKVLRKKGYNASIIKEGNYKMLYVDPAINYRGEYNKLLESYNYQQVAEIILKQLGGSGRLKAMIGAYDFMSADDEDGSLSFKFKAKSLNMANYIKITLTKKDDYNMIMGRISGSNYREIYEIEGLYAEDLIRVIQEETGLLLSL